ncbi:MAG: DUF4013 domain-containing protein [Candidatus Dojkabacteria bacterium]|nr:DUF4013 domain-containing protein [Candidatus Dojkabacteria bacterium]
MEFLNFIPRVFNDRRLLPKAGVIWAIFFFNTIFSLGINAALTSTDIFRFSSFAFPRGFSNDAFPLLAIAMPTLSSLILLPVMLYVRGYFLETADSIRTSAVKKDDLDVLPEHSNLGKTLTTGLVYIGAQFLLIGPLVLITMISAALPIVLLSSIDSTWITALLIAAFVFLMIILSVVMFAVAILVIPALMYVYLKYRDLGKLMSPSTIMTVITHAWPQFLGVAVIMLVINVLFGILTVVLCCCGPIVSPTVETAGFLVHSAMLGGIYYNLDKKKIL